MLAVAPLAAHHAISAKFDPARPTTLTGYVTKVDWANPHVHVLMYTPRQGVGRNLLSCMLARVWPGITALDVDLHPLLEGGFNGRLARKVLAVVNEIRLAGLPGRRGDDPTGGAVFTQGSANMDQLVRRLPRLVNAVAASVDRAAHAAPRERAAFDAYAKNVGALRQINATVKRYLDIDVTVAPQDVREIADAIREIQR